jgi:hypothetical protein
MQTDLSDESKKIRWAVGWVLSGAELPAYHWGQVKCKAPNKFQENCSKANTPIWWVDPVGPKLGWAPPTNRILPGKPTPRSKFCLLAFSKFSMCIPPFGGVDPVGPGLGWAPYKYNFTTQTHPEDQLLFASLPWNLKAYTPIWQGGPCRPGVGVSTPQKNFY